MPAPALRPLALTAATLLLGACGTADQSRPASAGAIPDADAACAVTADAGRVVVGSGLPGDSAAPEPASGYRLGKRAVTAQRYMVVAANPHAAHAGCEVLRAGGTAADAAVAVQAVLGLVEPQSSGLAGGAFMLYFDARTRQVIAYDGRETAPAAATVDYLRHVGPADPTAPVPSARASGRSIGTPGALRMLEMAQREHGTQPWAGLFAPAIRLSRDGFPVSGRLADAIAVNAAHLRRDADAMALYFDARGQPLPLGARFTNPPYAQTLERIAAGGADALYTGPVAQAIVAKIGATRGADGTAITPGLTTLADLAAYRAKRRDAICTSYRAYWVCGMPPPSSGGIAVAATLGILENFPLPQMRPVRVDAEGATPSVDAAHLIAEAERLAYADRDRYVADTDFVPLPGGRWQTLLDKAYLAGRAGRIEPARSMGTARAGEFGMATMGSDRTPEYGTTHVSIVDAEGNAVALTTTVEGSMGSYHVAAGMVLNNQLTDFSAQPRDSRGRPFANQVGPGKRPRSSMAPTLVFRMAADGTTGPLHMVTGSPGGGTIIQYVVKTLVGVLDWQLDAQQATSMMDLGAANTPVTAVGGEHPHVDARDEGAHDPLVQGLRARGHTVSVNAQSSGIGTIVVQERDGRRWLTGGADPRREGVVLGDGGR